MAYLSVSLAVVERDREKGVPQTVMGHGPQNLRDYLLNKYVGRPSRLAPITAYLAPEPSNSDVPCTSNLSVQWGQVAACLLL